MVFPFVKTQEKPQVEERRPERRVQSRQSAETFEAKMKSFLRDSNERLHDLKRIQKVNVVAVAVVAIKIKRWFRPSLCAYTLKLQL